MANPLSAKLFNYVSDTIQSGFPCFMEEINRELSRKVHFITNQDIDHMPEFVNGFPMSRLSFYFRPTSKDL